MTTATPERVERAPRLGRGRLLAALALLSIANACADPVAGAVAAQGWAAAALDGFGFSWVVWLATILAVRLALKDEAQGANAADLAVAGAGLVALALPGSHALPALAASLVGGWFALRRGVTAQLRAAALIVVAVAAQVFWVGAAMLLFGRYVEAVDAHLAAWIAGAAVDGNAVRFLHGPGGYYVAQGCAAPQNVAMALLLWLALARSARPAPRWGDLGVALGLTLTVMALNNARLAGMAQDVQTMHAWHGPLGASLYNALVTVVSLAWTVFDVRKELFGPVLDRDGRVAGADAERAAGVRAAGRGRPAG